MTLNFITGINKKNPILDPANSAYCKPIFLPSSYKIANWSFSGEGLFKEFQ